MEIERYSDIKDKIELRVVDMEIHGKEIENLASVRLGGGMYATFQVVIDRNEVAKISIPLTNELASELGCNTGIVLRDSAENMLRNDPTTLVSLDEVMRTMMFQENKERMRLDTIESLPDKSQIYVLSNESTFGGAFNFWIGDTKKELGRLLENNYYVLPSSNHELLIIPDSKDQCARDLGQMVRDVNNAIVEHKDLLSYKVFYYDRERDKLFTAYSPKLEHNREEAR